VQAANRDAFMATRQDIFMSFSQSCRKRGAQLANNRRQVCTELGVVPAIGHVVSLFVSCLHCSQQHSVLDPGVFEISVYVWPRTAKKVSVPVPEGVSWGPRTGRTGSLLSFFVSPSCRLHTGSSPRIAAFKSTRPSFPILVRACFDSCKDNTDTRYSSMDRSISD
jgi:hypothetical protein